MYKAHPYFSLENLDKQVLIIHGKIQYSVMVCARPRLSIRNYPNNEQGLEKLPGNKVCAHVICPDSQVEKNNQGKCKITKPSHFM